MSTPELNITEGLSPQRVSCTGSGYPALKYKWVRRTNTGEEIPISHIQVLELGRNLTRDDHGEYICVTTNEHGSANATLQINVLCMF